MRISRVKQKLLRGEPVLITTLHLIDPSIFELTSLMGFDGIWMDMEHHSYSLETASEMMRAARVGVSDILARPAKGEFMRMQRMLEAGAQGIMYPRCDNAEEAAQVVRWAKFPPLGERGCDAANPDQPYLTQPLEEYLEGANRETFIAIQIEQPRTVEHIEKIAAVEGVDVLFIGPGDLSIQSGIPGQFDHPKMQEVTRRVAESARREGKNWGCPSSSPQHTQQLLDMGARFICYNADILMVKSGLEKTRDDFTPMGFTFDDQLTPRKPGSP